MPRLPLSPDDIANPQPLVAHFRARHEGRLLEVERMLLHSPILATAWDGFFGGIKSGLLLSARRRELVACAVGSLNGADYQFRQHAGPYLAAGGSSGQLEALAQPRTAVDDFDRFDATDRAVLLLLIDMTLHVRVDDQNFAAARKAIGSDSAMVELVGVIAAYNLVSRFLVALEIEAPTTAEPT
jgi:alkylhydroperoxidase family enzyme